MKLSGIITIPFHIGDFLSGTMHMDTLEKGAYIMLLLAHYQAGEIGLPHDDKKLSRIAGVSMKTWERIKPTVMEKFDIVNSFASQKVVIECLQRVHDKSSKQRIKALKRHNAGYAVAKPQQCQPKPKPKPSIISKDIIKPDGIPDDLWNDFKSHRRAKKATITDAVINTIKREADKAGFTLSQAMEEMILRGWTGFKAEWVAKDKPKQQTHMPIEQPRRMYNPATDGEF